MKGDWRDPNYDPRVTSCPGCQCRVWKFPPRQEGGWDRYAIRLGTALVDIDGSLEYREAFVSHNCEPLWKCRDMQDEDRKALYQQRRKQRRKRQDEHKAATEWIREAQWALAHTWACPKCYAKVGEYCLNLVQRAEGITQPVKWPHAERLTLAGSDPHDPWANL